MLRVSLLVLFWQLPFDTPSREVTEQVEETRPPDSALLVIRIIHRRKLLHGVLCARLVYANECCTWPADSTARRMAKATNQSAKKNAGQSHGVDIGYNKMLVKAYGGKFLGPDEGMRAKQVLLLCSNCAEKIEGKASLLPLQTETCCIVVFNLLLHASERFRSLLH